MVDAVWQADPLPPDDPPVVVGTYPPPPDDPPVDVEVLVVVEGDVVDVLVVDGAVFPPSPDDDVLLCDPGTQFT